MTIGTGCSIQNDVYVVTTCRGDQQQEMERLYQQISPGINLLTFWRDSQVKPSSLRMLPPPLANR